MTNNADARKRLTIDAKTARVHLTRAVPYFAPLMLRQPLVVSDTLPPGMGAACDAKGRVYLGVAQAAQWSFMQLCGILLHETLHPTLDHFGRQGDRDPKTWNIAADVVINEMVRALGFDLPPGGAERVTLGVPAELTTSEAIYDWLQDNPDAMKPFMGDCDGGVQVCGTGEIGTEEGDAAGEGELTGADAEMARDEVASAIARGKAAGTIPAGLVVWADERVGPPRENWRARLAGLLARATNTFVRGRVQSDWRRLSRRSESIGVRLPGRVEPKPRVACVLDTSGSMWRDGSRVLSEAMGIVNAAGAAVDMLSCDTAAGRVVAVNRLQDLRSALTGGGGTDLQPAIDALAPVDRYAAIIVFTDGYLPPVTVPHGPRVIWALTETGEQQPWMQGAIVRLRGGDA